MQQKVLRKNDSISEKPLIWILPVIIVLIVFSMFPTIEGIRYSFTDMDLRDDNYSYTLSTYEYILGDTDIPPMLITTFYFVTGSIVGQLLFGLILALGLEFGFNNQMKGINFLKVSVLVSWIIPGSVMGIVWKIIFNEEPDIGILNHFITYLGFKPVYFMSSPNIAIITVTVTNIWKGTAFTMIMIYAGLQAIPKDLYDAATIDGAKPWHVFWNIKLPFIKPVLLINIIMISIATLGSFDMIYTFTGGGPGHATEVLALFLYNRVFGSFDISGGSVLAVLLLVLNVTLTVIYIKIALPKKL